MTPIATPIREWVMIPEFPLLVSTAGAIILMWGAYFIWRAFDLRRHRGTHVTPDTQLERRHRLEDVHKGTRRILPINHTARAYVPKYTLHDDWRGTLDGSAEQPNTVRKEEE